MEERKGKYDSSRDEVLDALSLQGWANESSGDVESPSGHFSRISNTEAELAEVCDAFEDEIASAGLEDRAKLLGHFLVITDEQGLVKVREYPSEDELVHEYRILDEVYGFWAEGRNE